MGSLFFVNLNQKIEYNNKIEIMESIFKNVKLFSGRMISHSKSGYKEKFPYKEVYFNANIFVLGEGKIWYGDIDITKEKKTIRKWRKGN